MGSGQSITETQSSTKITIESCLVQQHLEEMNNLKLNLKTQEERNAVLNVELHQDKMKIDALQKELREKEIEISASSKEGGTEKEEKLKEMAFRRERQQLQTKCEDYKLQLEMLQLELDDLNELKLNNEMQENQCKLLREELQIIQRDKYNLQKELKVKTGEYISVSKENNTLRSEYEQKKESFRSDNKILHQKNEDYQLQLDEMKIKLANSDQQLKKITKYLNESQKQFTAKSKAWEASNSHCSKLQSELDRYKSNKAVVQLVEFVQMVKKLTAEVQATAKKVSNEIKSQRPDIDETQLEKMNSEYYQKVDQLRQFDISTMSTMDFRMCVHKYKNICAANTEKTKTTMKQLYDVEKEVEILSTTLKNIPLIVSRLQPSSQKIMKTLSEVKQKSFATDFKEERKLYNDMVEAVRQINKIFNSVPNNLNKSSALEDHDLNLKNNTLPMTSELNEKQTEGKKKKRKKKIVAEPSLRQPSSLIIYGLPENGDSLDLVNVKYLLSILDVSNLDSVTVRRLDDDNYDIKPVIITLPDLECVKVLTNPEKIAEFMFPNIKIAGYCSNVH